LVLIFPARTKIPCCNPSCSMNFITLYQMFFVLKFSKYVCSLWENKHVLKEG
jgi:hypothetical protein